MGPFDNDIAADFCGELTEAPADERILHVRRALTTVADHGDGYLDSDFASEAIAAAAVVASQLPGGPAVTSPYAPAFLLAGGGLDIPADVPPLALRALDRVTGDDSEWRSLWEESPALHERALAEVRRIRAPLARACTAG